MDTPKHRPSISQLSKTPSWVMLGFILGGLVVWALPRRETPARPIIIAPREQKPTRPTEPPQLTTIEAVFEHWDEYAVWSNDVTQVALWNAGVGDFAEFYEVRRVDGVYYFRTLPSLTNRVIRHGKIPPSECPLLFTETEEQYREWREQGRFERPLERARPSITIPRASPTATPPQVPVTPIAPPMENSVKVAPEK